MTNRRTDFGIITGKSHEGDSMPGQDYCLAGPLPDGASHFLVVSDGCSNGAQTDLGSRTVARMLAKALVDRRAQILSGPRIDKTNPKESNPKRNEVSGKVVPVFWSKILDTKFFKLVDLASKAWFMGVNDLTATMLYGVFSDHEGFVKIIGDGVVGIKLRDGSFNLMRFEWAVPEGEKNSGGLPYYPVAYRGREKDFMAKHGVKNKYDFGKFSCRIYTNSGSTENKTVTTLQSFGTDLVNAEIVKVEQSIKEVEGLIEETRKRLDRMGIKKPLEPEPPPIPIEPQFYVKPLAPKKPALLVPRGKKENFFTWIFRRWAWNRAMRRYGRAYSKYDQSLKIYERREEIYLQKLAEHEDQMVKHGVMITKYQNRLAEWEDKCLPLERKIAGLKGEISYLQNSDEEGKEGLKFWQDAKEKYLARMYSEDFYGNYSVGSKQNFFEITEQYSTENGMRGVVINFSEKDLNQIECLAIFSDGITQIVGLDWKDAATRLLNYTESDLLAHDTKPIQNGIIRRKMAGMVGQNHSPIDDLSASVIHFGLTETKKGWF